MKRKAKNAKPSEESTFNSNMTERDNIDTLNIQNDWYHNIEHLRS
jgi:hypothetical protein